MIKDVISIDRFEIPFRVYESSGPDLVCLNGVQQSMAMWHTFIRRFCDKYRITLFDFPNQGKGKILSGSPNVTIDEQIEILKAVMKAADAKNKVGVCAASWGGVVALAFAARCQPQVKRLVLASIGTRPNKKMIETIKKGAEIDEGNREEMAHTLIESFGQDLPENIKQKIMVQFRTMSKENLRTFYEHGLFVVSTKELNTVVDLSKIKIRTILLHGEKDAIIDFDDVKFLASQIPNCEIRIVKDAGHFLHLEREGILDIYDEIFRKELVESPV
jgi:pimeloyl-ACP methyl ester carboxylesterase